MNDDIEITGCDLKALIKAAYELSRPQGMGFMHAKDGPLSDEEAEALIRPASQIPVSMDYVHGRAVKLSVFMREGGRLFIRRRWYDHSEAALLQLLDAIGVKHPEPV